MWFLCTSGRPQRCIEMLEAAKRTGISTPGLVVVNGGDQSAGYEIVAEHLPENWQIRFWHEETSLLDRMNALFAEQPTLPWYGWLSDDFVPVTDKWDQKLIQDVKESGGVVTANDRWQFPNRMLSSAAVFSGDMLRTMGFWMPPGFQHSFADDVLEKLGRDLQIWRNREDVVVEHHHYMNDKAPKDHVYEANYQPYMKDQRRFVEYMRNEYPALLGKFSQARQVDLSACKVMVATPCRGGMTHEYVHGMCSLMQAAAQCGVGVNLLTVPNESLITRARNVAVGEFMESDCTHLMFIDADMGFRGDDVLRLLASGQELVAAAGVRRQDGEPSFCVNMEKPKFWHEAGLLQVDEVGTGFMLISRGCLEKMIAHFPTLRFRERDTERYYPLLFDCSFDGELYWSEDYTFCRRWRETGGSVWVDPSIELIHVGNKPYRGRLMDALNNMKKKQETQDAAD